MFATEKSCQRYRMAIFPFVGSKNDYLWHVGCCNLDRVLMEREKQGSFSGAEYAASSDPLFLVLYF